MQINMSELFSSEGMSRLYQIPFEKKEVLWNGSAYPVTEADPVSLEILHVKNGVMKVTGLAKLHLSIPCDCCLEPVDLPFQLELDQEIDTSATDSDRIAALDEQPFVQGYLLDVDCLVCNELMLNMPMKVLCREDCKGLCPVCGTNLNFHTCDCSQNRLDPRMSVILDIFKKGSQQDS